MVQLEGNSFSEMIERNTTAINLNADAFGVAEFIFDASVQGSTPGTSIVNDMDTPYDLSLIHI